MQNRKIIVVEPLLNIFGYENEVLFIQAHNTKALFKSNSFYQTLLFKLSLIFLIIPLNLFDKTIGHAL